MKPVLIFNQKGDVMQKLTQYELDVILEYCPSPNLSGMDLSDLCFYGVDLRLANLKRANLEGADLRLANLEGANLDGTNLVGANLEGANLRRANLEGANLVEADLRRANLVRANLEGANLDGTNLVGANLEGANLRRANLGWVKLGGTNIGGANLEGADLRGSDLRGANLRSANLEGAKYADITLLTARSFPGIYKYDALYFIGVKGEILIRMGCLEKTLEEWDRIGIENSNLREFPNDGSYESERRKRAFHFVRSEALAMALNADLSARKSS